LGQRKVVADVLVDYNNNRAATARLLPGYRLLRKPGYALVTAGAVLTGFAEEVDAARRPFSAAAAVSQKRAAANRFFELGS